ncbi:MAG: cytochrome c [Chloroflexota bacterium]
MGRDASPETRRGPNPAGLLMVAVAVALGFLLSAGALQVERERRAAAQPPPSATPAGTPSGATAGAAAVAPSGLASATPTTPAGPPIPTSTPVAAAPPTQTANPTPVATSTPATPTAVPRPTSPPAAASGTGSPSAGSALFNSSCGGCHPGGKAGMGPSLQGLPEDRVVQAVREGKDAMPPYSPATLSDQQIRDIIAFLRSLD